MKKPDKTLPTEATSRLPFPPGLVNQTNTCFFNSTLQALISTSWLEETVRMHEPTRKMHYPPPPSAQQPLASPALRANQEQGRVPASMPLCRDFIRFLQDAYNARDGGRTSPLSPRDLLHTLGSKHDQYLDFRQQDAHELLRQLLDSMQMEESDEIRRQAKAADPTADPVKIDPEKNASFVDMVFGGQLASILVCDGCKHVSHSYEPFMDLSLSIKGDEANRKRDRLLQFVQKLRKPGPSASNTPASPPQPPVAKIPSQPLQHPVPSLPMPAAQLVVQVETPRSQSVPPGSPFQVARQSYLDNPPPRDSRRSMDITPVEPPTPGSPRSPTPSEATIFSLNKSSSSSLVKRLSVRLGSKPPSRGRSEKIKGTKTPSANQTPQTSPRVTTRALPDVAEDTTLHPFRAIGLSRSKSHSRTKSSRARKEAYMKAILRDTPTTQFHDHHLWRHVVDAAGIARPPSPSEAAVNAAAPWMKFGEAGGIVGCLKQFTAVETLEGDNSFACKKCWRKKNRGLVQKHEQARAGSTRSSSDSSDSDTDSEEETSRSTTSSAASSTHATPLTSPALPGIVAPSPRPAVDLQQLEATIRPVGVLHPAPVTLASIPTISTTSVDGVTQSERSRSGSSHIAASDESFVSAVSNVTDAPTASTNATSRRSIESPLPPLPPKSERVVQTRAFKRYLISAPPPVLVIHLKRFQQITRSPMAIFGTLRKVEDFIPFPEWLDLNAFMAPRKEDFGLGKKKGKEPGSRAPSPGPHQEKHTPQVVYRLCAVVVHIGNMLGGHYVAYSALPRKALQAGQPAVSSILERERQWCFISDTIVRTATLEEVLKAKAYLCFYERVR